MTARVVLAALVGLLAASVPGLAEEALSRAEVSPKNRLGVGVAGFERAAPAGVPVPDVATMLARRLDETPGISSVGPAQIGAVPSRPSGSPALRKIGEDHGIEALVTGRTTRLGGKVSVDVRVTATETGQLLGTLVEEVAGPGELGEAAGRMAARVVELARAPRARPVAAVPAVSAPRARSDLEASVARRSGPIEIQSEELEVLPENGGRRIRFRGRVRASQEGVRLSSERLEAVYPAGGDQPVRLEASGKVVVEEAARDRRMMCDRATYYRDQDRVVCRGSAEMRQGADHVRGDTIEIDLAGGRVRVQGGVELNVRGRPSEKQGA